MKIFKEINWGLHEITRYKSKYGLNIREPYLDKILNDSLIYSNNNIILNMVKYNFITIENGEGILTYRGKEMVNYANDRYELSDKQRSLVIREYIEVNIQLAKEWFAKFSNKDKGIERGTIELPLQQFTEDMIQLEIARQDDNLIYINKDYYQLIDLYAKKGMTEEELFRVLENNKILGHLAEKIAIEYEKNRLTKAGNSELAKSVQLISKSEVNAGYDIKSFKTISSCMYDAFIEVKYFNNNHFYLSQNEFNIAKELKEDYFLYLVNTDSMDIQIINNPCRNLKEMSKSIEVVCTKYTL
ncbi:DUF3883 domain-containing protein [Priestia megaterium]